MGVFLLLASAVPLVLLFLLWKYSYWYRQGVSQGNPFKLFGDMNDIAITTTPYCKSSLALGRRFSNKPFYGTYSATVPLLIVRDDQVVKDIFTKKFNSFGENGFEISEKVDPIVSRDPFFQPNGERWKETRGFFSSLMTPSRLRAMLLDTIDVTKETINYLKDHKSESGKGDGINIKRVASHSMTNLLIRLCLSLDAGCFKEGNSPFLDAERKIFEHWITGPVFSLVMLITPLVGQLRIVPQNVIDFYTNVIKDQKEYRTANGITRNDVLDAMMRKASDSKNPQNGADSAELDTIAVIIMFIVEGFETTSTNISTTIAELAKNPEIQDTLRQQILNYCPLGTDINEDVLNDVPLLHNCFLEALRLYPPVMRFQRIATEDVTLEAKTGEKLFLKKGAKVIIPAYVNQRDPEFFPNPETFDPDRFEDESQKRFFLSFGDGPRLCPGQRFALQASKILLAMILREFRLELSPKTQMPLVPANNPKLYSVEEIWVRFVPT